MKSLQDHSRYLYMLVKSPPTTSSNEDGGGGNDDAATRVYKRYKLSEEKVAFISIDSFIFHSSPHSLTLSFLSTWLSFSLFSHLLVSSFVKNKCFLNYYPILGISFFLSCNF